MRHLKILFSIITILFSMQIYAQGPTGYPTSKGVGWYKYGYVQSDSGTIMALRDTLWTPRFAGTKVYWRHAGVDSSEWIFNGRTAGKKWDKIGSGINFTAGLYLTAVLSAGQVNYKADTSKATGLSSYYLRLKDSVGAVSYVTPTKLTDSLANYFRIGGNARTDSLLLGSTNNKALYFKVNGITKASFGTTNIFDFGLGKTTNPEIHLHGDGASIYPALVFEGAGGTHGGLYNYTYRMDYSFDDHQFWNSAKTVQYGGVDAVGAYIGAGSRHMGAMFELFSTTQGSIPFPLMTQTQRDAIGASAVEGLNIYNTTTHAPNYYNGTSWVAYGSGGGGNDTTILLTHRGVKLTANAAGDTVYIDDYVRVATITSASTITPNVDTTNMYTVTALATAPTFAAPTGTAYDGQPLMIRIKDNGTARALTWNSIYRASTDFALPTTTVISKTMYVQFVYNLADTKWDAVGLTQGF